MSNAQEELLKWHAENAKNNPKIIHATERCAAGIIEAIGKFILGPNTSPRDLNCSSECKMEDTSPSHEIVKFYLFYEKWRRAEVENSDQSLEKLKAVCVSFRSLFSYVKHVYNNIATRICFVVSCVHCPGLFYRRNKHVLLHA